MSVVIVLKEIYYLKKIFPSVFMNPILPVKYGKKTFAFIQIQL